MRSNTRCTVGLKRTMTKVPGCNNTRKLIFMKFLCIYITRKLRNEVINSDGQSFICLFYMLSNVGCKNLKKVSNCVVHIFFNSLSLAPFSSFFSMLMYTSVECFT